MKNQSRNNMNSKRPSSTGYGLLASGYLRAPRARRRLSLPEVLISLAISALPLTPVAAASSASASAIDINDRFFRASQAARVSSAQLTSILRRCDSCQVGGTYDGVSSTVTASYVGVIYEDLLDGS